MTFGFFFFFFFAFATAGSCEQRGKATTRFGDQRYRNDTGRRGVAWGGLEWRMVCGRHSPASLTRSLTLVSGLPLPYALLTLTHTRIPNPYPCPYPCP